MADEFVAYCPAIETAWDLEVVSPIAHPFEGPMKTVEKTLAAFDDLLTPTKIEYVVFAASSNDNLENSGVDSAEQTVSGMYENERGISYQTFKDHLHGEIDKSLPYCVVTRVEVRNGRTRVILDGKEYEISADHHLFQSVEDDDGGRGIFIDPLQIIIFTPFQQSNDKLHHQIVVRTNTDLWFKESEAGAVNRQRLGMAFNNLRASFEVVNSEVASGKYPASLLRERGFSELIP